MVGQRLVTFLVAFSWQRQSNQGRKKTPQLYQTKDQGAAWNEICDFVSDSIDNVAVESCGAEFATLLLRV
jgi:hypothetical protein